MPDGQIKIGSRYQKGTTWKISKQGFFKEIMISAQASIP
jgi:hypothetical protein